MPNICELLESAALIIISEKPGSVWLPSLELSQLPSDNLISSHCNLEIVRGKHTKSKNLKLPWLIRVIFSNGRHIASKVLIENHNYIVGVVFKRLYTKKFALKFSKKEFSVDKLSWLGSDVDESGYASKQSKTESILNIIPPKTLEELHH